MVGSALAAVLFDMDGTLIDTEKVWEIAIRELAARYGGTISDATRARMLGAANAQTMRLLLADVGRPGLDPAPGAAWLDHRVGQLFAEAELEWRPGARELLAAVRAARIPTGLVTNTGRPLVEIALRTLGAANFDVVVCGDEVSHSKPHPAHYLAATTALGVEPGRCVAIEDSPTGVASAVAAGCAVLVVPHDVAAFGGPGQVVESLLDADVAMLRDLVAHPR